MVIILRVVLITFLLTYLQRAGEAAQPCGQRFSSKAPRPPSRRIVGGRDTVIEEWPWMVALLLDGEVVCGGSLVAPNAVVTAAHCFATNTDVNSWRVVIGQNEPKASDGIKPLSFARHPLFVYNAPAFDKPCDYDIALLKLALNVTPSASTLPICLLPERSAFSLKKNCHVTGWGRVVWKGHQPQVLQEITVDLVPMEVCNRAHCYNGTIHDRVLCAGPGAGGRGPCQFDSGGPLACEDSGLWYLTGLVSYGIGCALPYKYGVYTSMFQLTSWLRNQLFRDLPID